MNMFASAKVEAPKPKKSKAASRLTVTMDGLAELAAANALIDSITTIKATLEEKVKAASLAIFADQAIEGHKKPESFNLEDTGATGQFQLRKRAATSPLTPAEKAILEGFGLPVKVNTKVEECFKFRSEVLADPAMAERISAAICADPVLASMDLIVKQEAIKTDIVADDTLEKAASTLTEKNALLAVLKIAGVQALKTAFASPEMQEAINVLKAAGHDLFNAPEAGETSGAA